MYIKGFHNTPSAAHMAYLIGSKSEMTAKNILELQQKSFGFNLSQAREVLIKFFSGGMDYDSVFAQARLIKHEKVRNATLEILPLGREFIQTYRPTWFKPLDQISLSVSKGLNVPLNPLGLVAIDGKVSVVSSPLWKNIGLNVEQFRIWSTLTYNGMIAQNPDIDDFLWLEMSAPTKNSKRELSVRDMSAVDLLTELEFAGIRMNISAAMDIVNSTPKTKRERRKDPLQTELDV